MAKKTKYYAVAVGRTPGIYEDWTACERQVKGFRSAKFKSFPTLEEAEAFLHGTNTAANSNKANETTAEKPTTFGGVGDATLNSTDDENSNKRKLEPPEEMRHWLIRVYFDGGSRGNPGIGGSGAEIVLLENTTISSNSKQQRKTATTTTAAAATASVTQSYQERKKIHLRKYLGTNATNNQAEYHGLLMGVQRASQEIRMLMTTESNRSDGSSSSSRYAWTIDLEIRGDSELIIRQLLGEYKCRHPQLVILFRQVKECVEDLKRIEDLHINVSYGHVYREGNSKADALANEAMDMKMSCETIFHTDGTLYNGPLTNLQEA